VKGPLALILTLAAASPVAAQSGSPPSTTASGPAIAIRPFAMIAEQQFTARNTFDAVFGQSNEPFWGGGVQVVFHDRLFVELGAARFKKTGERTFRFGGQNYRLGIPLTVTETPVEVIAGYRFRSRTYPRIVPYVGAGFGSYGYQETNACPAANPSCVLSSFVDPSDNVDTRHVGALLVAGVEVRVHRWVRVAVDGQLTHIAGILGSAGVSRDARGMDAAGNSIADTDLGGIAARVKVVVGR
jgi:outer membrane protein W